MTLTTFIIITQNGCFDGLFALTPQSRQGQRTSYRTVSASSSVDESLFGHKRVAAAQAAAAQAAQASPQSAPAHGRRSTKRETVEIVTNDGIRKLAVPSQTAAPKPLVLSRTEFSRLQRNATVRTHSALERERIANDEAREALGDASTARKRETARLDATRVEPPSDLDIEARERNAALLEHAERMIEEQEDEIKRMNAMIAQAKVYAIRDAQLAEKDVIKAELAAEDRRLDDLMEYERVRALQEYADRDAALATKLQKCALDIRSQIKDREEQRMLDEELRDQETQAMLAQMRRDQEDVLAADARKREAGRKLLAEVAAVNEETQRIRAQRVEEEHQEDLRAAAYIKAKQAREEEQERQAEEDKRRREVELARMRARQEQAHDRVAERHARDAQRRQDDIERQFRKKEAAKAEAEARTNAMLREARQAQIAAKAQFVEAQVEQDRSEFMRVLAAQREAHDTEAAKQQAEHARRRAHETEVRQQIAEKERLAIEDRKAYFEEGVQLDHEAQARRARLDAIKQRKLAELEALGVDGKYLGPVRRAMVTSSAH